MSDATRLVWLREGALLALAFFIFGESPSLAQKNDALPKKDAEVGIPSPSAPDFQLTEEQNDEGLFIQATAPAGHHFNLKAPMRAQAPDGKRAVVEDQKNDHKTEKKLRFKFPKDPPPAPGRYEVSIYLCDNALTFCEKKTEFLDVSPHASSNTSTRAASASAGPRLLKKSATPDMPRKLSHPLSFGFWVDQPGKAFQQAKRENLPLMVDFFGIWCPPCNLLDERVFSSKKFARETRGFVKLKLDIDKEVSWPYTSRYKVASYPTVIFLNSQGEEISRIVGDRTLSVFLSAARSAYAIRNFSHADWEARAQKGDRLALDHIGMIALERSQFDEAVRALEKTVHLREKLWDARIGLANENLQKNPTDASLEKALIQTRQMAIDEFPETPDAVGRRMDLAEELEKLPEPKTLESKKRSLDLYRDSIQVAERLAQANPEITAQYDSSAGDLWAQSAEAHTALGEKDQAIAAYRRAAAEFQKQVKSPSDRGGNLELAYCLWKSGNETQAEAIYQRLEKIYPKDFTFFLGHSRMKFTLGELSQAQSLAEKAVSLAYGSNRLESTLTLAKILASEKQTSEARRKIEDALATPLSESALKAQAEISNQSLNDSNVRYFRSLKRLREFENTLPK